MTRLLCHSLKVTVRKRGWNQEQGRAVTVSCFMNFLKNTEDAHTEDQLTESAGIEKGPFYANQTFWPVRCAGAATMRWFACFCDCSDEGIRAQSEPEAKLLQWCRFAQMNEAAHSSSWVLKRRLITKGCHEGRCSRKVWLFTPSHC